MDYSNRIKHFPISFFSVVMGLTGLTISLQKASDIFILPKVISSSFLFGSIAIFITLTIIYLTKVLLFRKAVIDEFSHPIKINFFPAFSISLLLLSIAFLSINMGVSKYLWYCGTLLHFVLTLAIISTWMHHDRFKTPHMNPSWFIPAVGNILVPVAGTTHFNHELSWFFFGFGLFFWMILMTIFFYRMFFHESLPEKLLPTLFILIAPPSVGFISYLKLTGSIDGFSKTLYFFAVFLTILLLSQVNIFRKIRRYYLSWWAYSFPLASISIASVLMYHETSIPFYKYFHLIILVLLSALIVLLISKTVTAIAKKEICIEE